tara:strand:+ start:3240 stop:3653 length:414 start_codon:yes stop_codon:yes gene_type:complete
MSKTTQAEIDRSKGNGAQLTMTLNKTKKYQVAPWAEFGVIAHTLMLHNNWSEASLSSALGYSSNAISAWRGRKKVPVTALLALNYLALTIDRDEQESLTGSEAVELLTLLATHYLPAYTSDQQGLIMKLAKMTKRDG